MLIIRKILRTIQMVSGVEGKYKAQKIQKKDSQQREIINLTCCHKVYSIVYIVLV